MFLIVLMCICVVAQMLGTPITLTSLLTADMSMESVSGDFSIHSVMLEVELTSHRVSYEKSDPSRYHQIFETSAFHPPQA